MNYKNLVQPSSLSLSDVYPDYTVTPQQRIQIMDPDKYEEMTEVWLSETKMDMYEKTLRNAGSNDLGRDIVCFYNSDSSMDIYQCKHYKNKLNYALLADELLKVIYHVFRSNYITPTKYYIVSPQGCSNTLRTDYLESKKHLRFNEELLKTLDKGNHTFHKEKMKSIPGIKDYIKSFDFSIVEEITPQDLIDSFQNSKYAPYYLGIAFSQFTRDPLHVPSSVQKKENLYVTQLCKVYSEIDKKKYNDPSCIPQNYINHFEEQRTYFYSLESYKNMIRDNLPSLRPFNNIESIIHQGISDIISDPFSSGYNKLSDSLERSVTMNLDAYTYKTTLLPNDKKGMCHNLVNEGKTKWI